MPEELRDLGDEEFVKGCRTLGGSVRFLEPTGEPSRALLPEALRRLEAWTVLGEFGYVQQAVQSRQHREAYRKGLLDRGKDLSPLRDEEGA